MNNQIKQLLEKWSASINEKKYRETAQCYEPLTCNALMRQADKPMENEGVYNIETIFIRNTNEIRFEDAKRMLYDEYGEEPVVLVLELEAQTRTNTKYFGNGINFKLVSFVKYGDEWKIEEMIQIAEPEELLQKGYVFSENYKYAVKNMEDRRNGIFRTSNGELIGTKTSGRAVLNERTIPKDTDKVRLMNYFNGGSNIEVLNFWNYILAVSAGECRGKEFDGEARKAINMAIKTYTWHFLLVPKSDTMGYDITTKMQAYAPSYISENKKVTEDMEAVHNVWMESYKGAIFENLIADIFSKMGRKLYYYHKDSGLEIDFVMRYKGQCTLVEVKATTGNTKSTRTILNHPEKYHVTSAIKLGDYNVGNENQILTLPLYMAFLLDEM